MAERDDVPRPLKLLSIAWPIIISLVVAGATMVQAATRVSAVEQSVHELKVAAEGPPSVRERLASIEAKQDDQTARLERIEKALDRREGR